MVTRHKCFEVILHFVSFKKYLGFIHSILLTQYLDLIRMLNRFVLLFFLHTTIPHSKFDRYY